MMQQLFSTTAGKILLVALMMSLMLVVAMVSSLFIHHNALQSLPAIAAANLIFGRAAGIATGYASSMNDTLVVIANMYIETTLVLLVFALFLMIWDKMLVHERLKRFMDSFTTQAKKYEPLITKYGPIGLFFFVFLPFWMTGPTVGIIIGYFMGMSISKNLLVVLGGTNVAIVVWAFLIAEVENMLLEFSPMATWGIVIFFVLIAGIALLIRLRRS